MNIKDPKDRQHTRTIRLSDDDWKIFKEYNLLKVIRDKIKKIKKGLK